MERVVAGLHCNEYLFSVSLPYSDISTVADEEEKEKTIDELVSRYLLQEMFTLQDCL